MVIAGIERKRFTGDNNVLLYDRRNQRAIRNLQIPAACLVGLEAGGKVDAGILREETLTVSKPRGEELGSWQVPSASLIEGLG
jgi:hypothetical protein